MYTNKIKQIKINLETYVYSSLDNWVTKTQNGCVSCPYQITDRFKQVGYVKKMTKMRSIGWRTTAFGYVIA